jgi:putative nucleotidyltransferase-like protein
MRQQDTEASRLHVTGHYWPTDEQELFLRAALGEASEALQAWRAIRDRLDLDRVDIGSRRLLPLLAANLRRHGVDDSELGGCLQLYRETRSQNHALFDAVAAVVRTLTAEGIETMVLKGWALAELSYKDIGLRPMSDVDLLVRRTEARRASQILRQLGWSPEDDVTPSFARTRHGVTFKNRPGQQCDLHWWIFEEYCPASLDEEVWASSVAVDLQSASTRVLAPADQLLHVCIHGAKWARTPGIRWIADAVLVLRAGPLDWHRLISQAERRGFVLRMRQSLRYLRALTDVPMPPEAWSRLASRPVAPFERFEHWVRSREHPLMGALPFHWCNYVRSVEARSPAAVSGFGRYLRDLWGLDSVDQVLPAAFARAAVRVRGRR